MGRTLAFLVSLLLVGCSTRVEVSTERRPTPSAPPATENFSTKVAVDLLTNPEQVPCRRPQPPAPTEANQPEVEVAGTANTALIVEGDFHLHTHYHDHIDLESRPAEKRPASRRNQEKSEIETREPGVDPECASFFRQHEQQVARWRRMMGL